MIFLGEKASKKSFKNMCYCIIIIYLLRIVLLHLYNISKYSVRRKMYLTELARELKN